MSFSKRAKEIKKKKKIKILKMQIWVHIKLKCKFLACKEACQESFRKKAWRDKKIYELHCHCESCECDNWIKRPSKM